MFHMADDWRRILYCVYLTQYSHLVSHVRALKQKSNNKTFLSAQLLTEILFYFYINKISLEL